MTQTATRTRAKATAPAPPQTYEFEIGRGGQGVLNRLANARARRLEAEKEEGPLKERLKDFWLPKAEELKLKRGDTLNIKAVGVVRGRVTMRSRGKTIDLDLLMQAFPEAYTACVSENESLQFDPA